MAQSKKQPLSDSGSAYPAGVLEDPKPNLLLKADRGQAVIVSWEGSNVRNYRIPSYHPDALIAGKGYPELDKMKTTSAYAAPTFVKKYAALHKGWRVSPPEFVPQESDAHKVSQEIADALTYFLWNIIDEGDNVQDFRHVLWAIADGYHAGVSTTEMVWRYVETPEGPDGRYKGLWGWRRFAHKQPQQIGFDLDPFTLAIRNVTNRSMSGPYRYDIPVEKCIIYTFRPEYSLPYGRGDGRICYKHWFLLDIMEKVHAIALERFGTPFLVGKVPAGDDEQMVKIGSILDDIRNGASAVLPDNMEVELKELSAQSLSGFEHNKEWHKRQMSYLVLSNELTMQQGQGQGSYALGEVHQTTQEYGFGFGRRDLESVVRQQVFRRFVRYNWGPEFEWLTPNLHLGDWDNADRKMVSEWADKFLQHGVLWKKEPFLRGLAHLPPIDPQSQKEMAEEEAFQRTVATTKLIKETTAAD